MLAVLFPFLKKFGPYIAAAGLCFLAGSYAGYRFEYGAVEAATLALVTQQRNDATETAAANGRATTYLAELQDKENVVDAGLVTADAKAGSSGATLTAQIATQSAHSGQDAQDAPVLAITLDSIAKGNP